MGSLGSFFLRARHWQIFGLIMGPYLLGAAFAVSVGLGAPLGLRLETAGLLIGAASMLGVLCYMAWIGSMGLFLNASGGPSARLNTGFLWVALIYPGPYSFAIALFVFTAPPSVWVFLPLHLFAMLCIFYAMYFASKCLTRAELSRPVTFSDCLGPLFLIWFFPLGIWVLQPRINRLYAKTKGAQAGVQPAALP